jgi:hypothetical protein
MRSGVKDCGGCVNHGTGGGNAKENARSLADAEDCDKGNEKRDRNDEE